MAYILMRTTNGMTGKPVYLVCEDHHLMARFNSIGTQTSDCHNQPYDNEWTVDEMPVVILDKLRQYGYKVVAMTNSSDNEFAWTLEKHNTIVI